MRRIYKVCGALFSVLAALSMSLPSTFAWQSLGQTAQNAIRVDAGVTDELAIEKVVEGEGAPKRLFEFLLRGEEGSPMPAGSSGRTRRVYLEGGGSVKLGTFPFTEPGVFLYTLTETAGSGEGWTFDRSVYTLRFTVTVGASGGLAVKRELFQDGQPASRIVFHNKYAAPIGDDQVEVSGRKIWFHGDNPPEGWPDSVVILVYADGKLIRQQRVTAAEDWEYSLLLPRYEDGREIVYTIGEKEAPGYSTEIDGYDVVNRFIEDGEPSPAPAPTSGPAPSAPPSPPGSVQTGDTGELGWWMAVTVTGVLGLALCLGYRCYSRHKYVGKRLRKR